MRKSLPSTATISLILLSLTIGGCFWNPPELSLAEAGAEGESGEAEGGESESAFEPESEAEAEGGESESAFEPEFEAEAEGGESEAAFEPEFEAEAEGGESETAFEPELAEGGESEAASTEGTEVSLTNALPLTGKYALEFIKTTGHSECAQFGEVRDLKVSDEGLMSGELYYAGNRGGPFRGRVRANGTWSAIGPDEGYEFKGVISDDEVSGNYTAPAPTPTEGETNCEGTVEGFRAPD